MPYATCSIHRARDARKYASVYMAWFRADGVRTAYKSRMCLPGFKELLGECLAHVRDDTSDVTACPACGSDASPDLDPIYLTVYAPGQERSDFGLTTCAACAAMLRSRLQNGAEKLEERPEFHRTPDDSDGWGEVF